MKVLVVAAFAVSLCFLFRLPDAKGLVIGPAKCSTFVMEDCLEKEKARLTGSIICLNNTEEHLTSMLKDIGGYNPLYVAANIYEALNFEDPTRYYFKKTTTAARKKLPKLLRGKCGQGPYLPGHPCFNKPATRKPTEPLTTLPPRTEPLRETPPRQTRPQPIRPTRPRPTTETRSTLPNQGFLSRRGVRRFEWPLNDDAMFSSSPESSSRPRREIRVKRTAGQKIEGCWGKGTKVDGQNRFHMCSTCHVIKTLPNNQFPRYLNEGACRHGLSESLVGKPKPGQSHRSCVANAGICEQKFIKSAGMILEGYVKDEAESKKLGKAVFKQKWKETTLNIRSCCECEITKHTRDFLGLIGKRR